MATMTVTPGTGQTVNLPPADGRAAASASRPVTLSTEDKAVLDLVATAANQTTEITALNAINGKITAVNTGAVVVSSSALPSGASTETTLAAQSAKLPATLGQKAMTASMAVTLASDQSTVGVTPAAGELHLGEVGGNTTVVSMTFTLDTSIYASGDVLAATAVLSSALRKNDGTGILQSITLNDKDDQGIALYVVILDANNSLGSANAACSISDANADSILAIIPVESSDWIDLGGCRVAHIRNLGIPVKATSGAATLYVALITRGTPLHTASGITGRFGILRD